MTRPKKMTKNGLKLFKILKKRDSGTQRFSRKIIFCFQASALTVLLLLQFLMLSMNVWGAACSTSRRSHRKNKKHFFFKRAASKMLKLWSKHPRLLKFVNHTDVWRLLSINWPLDQRFVFSSLCVNKKFSKKHLIIL